MKRTISIGFLASMFLTTAALAGDVDDIKAAEMDFRAKESAGNVEGYFAYKAPTYSIFPPTRGMLSEGQDIERAKARFGDAAQRDMQIRNIGVQLYGNTAVSTYYLISTTRRPGSEPQRRTLRMTGIWAKQDGQWKVVHRHESDLSLRSTPRAEERFVGTWKFVSIEFRGPDGEPRSAPAFKNGLLIYTPTGEVSLQLMRDGRKEFAAGRPTPEEAQAGILSYFAYFGTFTVNEAEGTVTHHRQAHLIPNRITDGPRSYQFSGNRMRLTTPPIMDGIIQTLTWERVE
jgi:ketosteroid isomerase-like protein